MAFIPKQEEVENNNKLLVSDHDLNGNNVK